MNNVLLTNRGTVKSISAAKPEMMRQLYCCCVFEYVFLTTFPTGIAIFNVSL